MRSIAQAKSSHSIANLLYIANVRLVNDIHSQLNEVRMNDVEGFADAYRGLEPKALELLARLSPLSASPRVRAPVEIVVPPSDVYFPLGEAHSLAAALPRAHLTVTATLDHTRPRASLAHLRSLLRFDRFVVRGLRTASVG